jgi:hypothetical protein
MNKLNMEVKRDKLIKRNKAIRGQSFTKQYHAAE